MYQLIILTLIFSNFSFSKDLIIPLGESARIPLVGNQVWIEKKNIVRATVEGHSLRLSGIATGTSYLKNKNTLYLIQVLRPNIVSLYKTMSDLIKGKLGLKLTIHESQIEVTGHLFKLQDWLQLAENVGPDDDYVFKARLGTELSAQVKDFFTSQFKIRGLADQIISFGGEPQMKIHPKDPHFSEYKIYLKKFGIPVLKDSTSLILEPIIKVQITVAEIDRAFMQNYGVELGSPLTAQLLPASEVKPFEAQLSMLESSGKGRLLASPNLLCKSGKEAEFLAGGEIPIKSRSRYTNDIIWKKYGVFMKVRPKADYLGRISVSLETEVSSIDSSLTIDGIPGITTNKVSSFFDLPETKIIALSGLLKEVHGDSYSGMPFLSRLPILGPLFSSRDFKEKRTELVIFVKPEVMTRESDINVQSKVKHLRSL